jgi:nicotinate-nucleotide adenylyltransferase
MKIALYSGSFNPIGKHHINIANRLLDIVDEVWLLPCYKSSIGKQLIDGEHRINMCKLACNNSRIKICDYEINNKIEKESIDVMKLFLDDHANLAHTFYFVIGSDNLSYVHASNSFDELLKLIPFIVVPREGYNIPENSWCRQTPHIYLDKFELIKGSSTQIRKNIYNLDIIDQNVLKYIIKNKLIYLPD